MGNVAAKQADELEYPQSWLFGDDGDLVAGTFVKFDEGMTNERSVWLSQMALFNRVRDELNRRASKQLEPGERVVIQRHEKKKGKNDREYWPFTIAFPDRPEKSTNDLFELDEGHVKHEQKEPTEPAPGDVGPDGDIPF